MNSLLCNWFDDWGRAIYDGLGETWLIILTLVFAGIALFLLQNILRASINKTKIKIKWFQIIFCIIFILFTIWFCTILTLR